MKPEPLSDKQSRLNLTRLTFFALCALLIFSAPAGGTEPAPSSGTNREAMERGTSDNNALVEPRETHEKIEESSDTHTYLYKAGLLGFLRGEGSGNYTYSLNEDRYTPGQGIGRLAYRIRPYLEWHPTDWLEVEVEGQGYGFTLGSPRDSHFLLYKAYLEFKEPDKQRVTFKIGRQEFVFGTAFILGSSSFRDGLTYDAARLQLQPIPGMTLDLFGSSYAAPQTRYFNDFLGGAYLSHTINEGTGIDVYYVRDDGPQYTIAGEHADIFGLRGIVRMGPASLELEPVFATGQAANPLTNALETISAWGGHVDLNVDTEVNGMKNTFALGYAYGSGSQDAADGGSIRKQFSNPDTDTGILGDMGFIPDFSGVTLQRPDGSDAHGSGLHVATLGWGINLLKNLNFSAMGHYFVADKTPSGVGRTIGLETDFILTWNLSDSMALIAAYDRIFTGDFFRDATGHSNDLQYGYVMFQFNFFGGKKKLNKG